jgi:ribosomal protein L29
MKAFPKFPQGPRNDPLPPKAKSMPRQYTTRLETDEEAYNRMTQERLDAGMPPMTWSELRHIQDRAREMRAREMDKMRLLSREALEKKSEELKQRLLGSRLRKWAKQKEIELKPAAKRMPRRETARVSAPAHVCPFKEVKFHVCAPDCVNWVVCPTTGEPMRINRIECVQEYGNSSSDEDMD